MKKLAFLLLSVFTLLSCGATKSSFSNNKKDKSYNLPPDVGSNKYSKTRG
tara:strand:- start:444 stop:593 length:150 start_codon:yes stop_codon:yes gene_type:complete